MKKIKKNLPLVPVSVVIPMRNSETTIGSALRSLLRQKYPIEKIIVVDNASIDNSIKKVEEIKNKSIIPIHIMKRKENKGLCASYNFGVNNSISSLVVFMHSDSSLSTVKELEKLTKPLTQEAVVASYPSNILPKEIWDKYSFWQKRHQIKEVNNKRAGMNGKFDCIRRKIFLKIGGFDEVTYNAKCGFGGEDADLFFKLEKEGRVILSEAKVIHLHRLSKDYSFFDWMVNRKLLAKTYGRLLRFRGNSLPISTKGKGLFIPLGFLIFTVKPILAILPFVPKFHLFGIILLFVYVFLNSPRMYLTRSTLFNPCIILLPFIDIFLVYYETFWMSQAFLLAKRNV
ncbi:glycosyltransferase family 2 protein [Candidatus Microgenomates bacterium]|nr:MAG: glycosyltransferase family 2 protein [Candidatus Microgenomates bacterium]